MNPQEAAAPRLVRMDNYFIGSFNAMASPCTVLIDTDDSGEAENLLRVAQEEAQRIEQKFSRYRTGNIIHQINTANGQTIRVDEETAGLLDYAAICYEMSGGLFDITSGALRRLWTFDGGNRIPTEDQIQALLPQIGWTRVSWHKPEIHMPAGMELDLGGIGKEYAVDRAAAFIAPQTRCAFVVNFGGDLFVNGLRRGNRTWGVGIDDPERTGEAALYRLDISKGGIATTGDARRFITWKGKRLSHILNPKTGWPVEDAPRSVTVAARTCMEAGTFSTLGYLQGANCSNFLKEQGVNFWIL